MRIGENMRRVDGAGKVTGETRFTDDMRVEGLWHGVVVRSPAPAGRIRGLTIPAALERDGVVVVTPADIPGENVIASIKPDMPCLAHERVRYLGEPVALVAAADASAARRAASMIEVDVEPSEALFSMEEIVERFKAGGDLEIFSEYTLSDGDVDAALEASAHVLEREYRTGPQEHVYLETQAMTAIPGTQVRCVGSLQCPYYVRPAVARVLGVEDEAVVVEQAAVGGAFGGKEDFPSLLASHAALLATKSGRPVRIAFDRQEDIAFTTKRHASWTRIRTGTGPGGQLLALEADLILDAGAYVTLSPVVLSRAILHLSGPYSWGSVRLRALAVASNMPPSGAFRGFGAPQALFAIESHMDEIARASGISPLAQRRSCILRQGGRTATGQVLTESVGAEACLESVTRRCDFEALKDDIDAFNGTHARQARGIGIAAFQHGAGFTGNGERDLRSRAALRLAADGTVEILAANTEMGQGVRTAFTQIVCDGLDLPPDRVTCPLPDTSRVPNSGPTVASRSTMIVGRLLERASALLVEKMKERLGNETLPWAEAAAIVSRDEPLVAEVEHEVPPGIEWDESTYRGSAYPVYSWGAAAVEVAIDRDTLVVTPRRMWLAFDIGRAVNPLAARGQLEGGALQALGWGLYEGLDVAGGRYAQDRLQTYIIPTSEDVPEVDLEIVEIPCSMGPGGAKGLGELPMNGPAAALRNAVSHALGRPVDEIPLTPEKLLAGRTP